ncbi:hypothetical protein Bbelb_391600 [Branchiostoma belcheri]|nr:hypothetical protein Bbelb_391600 [Branchiostoma belcheri]
MKNQPFTTLRPEVLTSFTELQHDPDELSSWTEDNKMKLNPTRCKAMHIYFARNLSINGNVLEAVPIAKCLGVTFQANLGWDSQVTGMAPCEELHLQTLDDRRTTLCLKYAKKLFNSDEYRVGCTNLVVTSAIG